MLAHEIYHRSNARGTPCDLLTGEERQLASGSADAPSSHMSCTVEMADLESYCEYECVLCGGDVIASRDNHVTR